MPDPPNGALEETEAKGEKKDGAKDDSPAQKAKTTKKKKKKTKNEEKASGSGAKKDSLNSMD